MTMRSACKLFETLRDYKQWCNKGARRPHCAEGGIRRDDFLELSVFFTKKLSDLAAK